MALGQGLAVGCSAMSEANNFDLSSVKSFMSSFIDFT